jgi:hypothetical protein
MLYSHEFLAAEAAYRQERVREVYRPISSDERRRHAGRHDYRSATRLGHALRRSHAHAHATSG